MGLRPNGGLISSELLIECIPDVGAEEEIWKMQDNAMEHARILANLRFTSQVNACAI